jgi:hypothetical protein
VGKTVCLIGKSGAKFKFVPQNQTFGKKICTRLTGKLASRQLAAGPKFRFIMFDFDRLLYDSLSSALTYILILNFEVIDRCSIWQSLLHFFSRSSDHLR